MALTSTRFSYKVFVLCSLLSNVRVLHTTWYSRLCHTIGLAMMPPASGASTPLIASAPGLLHPRSALHIGFAARRTAGSGFGGTVTTDSGIDFALDLELGM